LVFSTRQKRTRSFVLPAGNLRPFTTQQRHRSLVSLSSRRFRRPVALAETALSSWMEGHRIAAVARFLLFRDKAALGLSISRFLICVRMCVCVCIYGCCPWSSSGQYGTFFTLPISQVSRTTFSSPEVRTFVRSAGRGTHAT
jgi:hypothetical protein